MPAEIDIRKLTKEFDGILAVDNFNLQVEQGEMLGIVGPDGAGKTTLLRLLAGTIAPSSGTATILGYDLIRERKNIHRKIGYLSQKSSLYGDLTIDENIEFFSEIHEVYNYRNRREELLELTHLTPYRNRLVEHLSGGMKQKAALACTLVHQPRILLLDEPTTGIDPVSRRDFWKILSDLLKSNITIITTTPYLDEAERCSRVAFLNAGKLVISDTPAQLKTIISGDIIEITCDDIRHAYNLILKSIDVDDIQSFGDRLNIIVKSKQEFISSVKKVFVDGGIQNFKWRQINPSLENVFINLLRKQ